MKNIYPELALYGSTNESARTDTVFFPISQVCTRGVTLNRLGQRVNDTKPYMYHFIRIYKIRKDLKTHDGLKS